MTRPVSPQPLFLFIWLVVSTLALPFAARAQTAPAPLPPAAQAALDKGIIAAKVPDFPLAIRYFEDARKLAPLAPVVFMNLGIAESKMPGRELRAIAWFGAYLAALPGAPHAAAVKEQIAVLEVRNQSNVARFLKTVQDAANQTSVHKGENLCLVAMLMVKAGDISEAAKIIDRLRPVPVDAEVCVARRKREIAKAQEPPDAPSQERRNAGVQAATDEFDRFYQRGGFDWLHVLDGKSYSPTARTFITFNKPQLGAVPFVDLAGYLKSLPPADAPQNIFRSLHQTATELVDGQVIIRWLLERHVT